jgi:hypothetical protein
MCWRHDDQSFKKVMRLSILALFIHISMAHAQHIPGGWLMYWGAHPIGKSYELYSEVQFRQKELPSTHEQLLLRTGIGRKINERNSIGTGYGAISYYQSSNDWMIPDALEHRWWGQWVNQYRRGPNILEHRVRSEHRWFDDVPKWRWRYRLMWVFPIHVFNESSDALVIHLSNEVFLHRGASLFDRNRMFAALGYHCNTHCEMQIGYLHQNAYKQATGNYIQLGFLIH